jgi:hypothetical protein
MKKIRLAFIPLLAVIGIATAGLGAPAYAAPADEIRSGVNAAGNDGTSLESRIQTIVNILLFILGAIAVIMIIIGGIRYTTSNGDASAITSAKNTILYAVVGLVVAILAYAIVNFILASF